MLKKPNIAPNLASEVSRPPQSAKSVDFPCILRLFFDAYLNVVSRCMQYLQPPEISKNPRKNNGFSWFSKDRPSQTNTNKYNNISKKCQKRGIANNTPQKLPKTLLRQPHNLPKSPKMPKDVLKTTPRPLEVAPRGLQKAAKRPQDAAKTPSRWLQDAETLLQGAPRPPQDPLRPPQRFKKRWIFNGFSKCFLAGSGMMLKDPNPTCSKQAS